MQVRQRRCDTATTCDEEDVFESVDRGSVSVRTFNKDSQIGLTTDGFVNHLSHSSRGTILGTHQEMQSSARLIDFPATDGERVVLPRCDRHGSINIIMLARFGNVSNGAGDGKTNESFLTPRRDHNGVVARYSFEGEDLDADDTDESVEYLMKCQLMVK